MTEQFDCTPDPDEPGEGYEPFSLPQSDGPEVRFLGKHLGGITTEREGSWRWTELDAYCTRRGRWIIHQRGMTTRESEVDRLSVHIYDSVAAMTKDLGYKNIYLKLWAEIGIDAIHVE